MTERTFSIIKPDATRRNLTGKVNAVIEDAGLRIVAQRRIHMTRAQAEKFYEVHKERPFFGELVEFMMSAPVVVQVLEGKRCRAVPRSDGCHQPGPGCRRHDPQAVRRKRRRELGPWIGQPRKRQAGDGPVLHRRRHRRLIRRNDIGSRALPGDRHTQLNKRSMRENKVLPGFSERLAAQAEARKALLEKFKPKPTVVAEVLETRETRRARELEEVRAKRAADKEAVRLAKEKAELEARLAIENDEELMNQLKREDRKARKAQAKADARNKREMKSQVRRTG